MSGGFLARRTGALLITQANAGPREFLEAERCSEIHRDIYAAGVVGVEDKCASGGGRSGLDDHPAVFTLFVAEDEEIGGEERAERSKVGRGKVAAPGQEMGSAAAGDKVVRCKFTCEDAGVESIHQLFGRKRMSDDDTREAGPGFEASKQGEAEHERLGRVTNERGIVTESNIDGFIKRSNTIHAVLGDAAAGGLGDLVIGEQDVDMLWIGDFQSGDTCEDAIGVIQAVAEAIGVDEFMQDEVLADSTGSGGRNFGEAGGMNKAGEVKRMVVQIAGGDEKRRLVGSKADDIGAAAATGGVAGRVGASMQHGGDSGGVAEVQLLQDGTSTVHGRQPIDLRRIRL